MADSFSITSPAATDSPDTDSPDTGAPEAGAASAEVPVVTRDRLPPSTKAAYAAGGSTDIFGHWLYNGLADPVYNVFLGLSPTQVSITRATTLLVDAFSGLLFGWLSDNTRSRWGRRRPYVLIGSIVSGLALPVLFMARPTWTGDEIFLFMIISAALYAPLIASYNTPYQSLGAELTPDYNERTSVMAYKAVVQKAAGALIGGALWFANRPMWTDPSTGKVDVARGAVWAAAIAGGWMIVSGILNFAFVKERYYGTASAQGKSGFIKMFREAFSCKPYLVLLGTAVVYAVPTGLVNTLGFYSLTYHVFRGDMASASELLFWGGLLYMVLGILGVFAANWVARALGKRNALIVVLLIGLVAFGSSFWLYTPEMPWLSVLCGGLNGFSATGLWVILPSMTVDVIDYDELSSGKRREGAYTATFSWVMKFGMMFSMLIGGPLLELTGFDAKRGGDQTADAIMGIRLLFAGIPVTALVIAFVVIYFYPLDTERMRVIRSQLEARRGTV